MKQKDILLSICFAITFITFDSPRLINALHYLYPLVIKMLAHKTPVSRMKTGLIPSHQTCSQFR